MKTRELMQLSYPNDYGLEKGTTEPQSQARAGGRVVQHDCEVRASIT